ncbi:MAG: hypothetical protein R3298_11225 [Gammaproteobacteria bacterium]|nr:hypothetical protein [Gammaproteobacteria bacterium]
MDPAVVALIRSLGTAMVLSAVLFLALGWAIRTGLWPFLPGRRARDRRARERIHLLVSLLSTVIVFLVALAAR